MRYYSKQMRSTALHLHVSYWSNNHQFVGRNNKHFSTYNLFTINATYYVKPNDNARIFITETCLAYFSMQQRLLPCGSLIFNCFHDMHKHSIYRPDMLIVHETSKQNTKRQEISTLNTKLDVKVAESEKWKNEYWCSGPKQSHNSRTIETCVQLVSFVGNLNSFFESESWRSQSIFVGFEV